MVASAVMVLTGLGLVSTPQSSAAQVPPTTHARAQRSAAQGSAANLLRATVERIAGADRYEQSALVSARAFPGAELVYLASGEKFADALGASSIAAIHRAPLLLVQSNRVPPSVAAELARLSPASVVLVGGTASVDDDVLVEVSRAAVGATVSRIDGADRYEVSRRLLTDDLAGVPDAMRLTLASGRDFPDALSSASAAARQRAPVVLVDGLAPLSPPERALVDDPRLTSLTIAGGTASVSATVEAALHSPGRTVTRLAGDDRYETSVAVNRAAYPAARTVFLASGSGFADALSGGPLAAASAAPLYVVRPDCVPRTVLDELTRLSPSTIILLGGTVTLTPAVASLTPCP
ncbi:cell wall-binding repeat-containing protein [Herbiconiux sp. KACC 21604]|uniref:cell wall-binding repeat-containing protein n=1 Tax=unclassified Herbiconiux TaxID=2618217 RepID=UPI0014910232|nr:cell wall-binding repeat-containing protein [Herbiconiux sp. SALV-R1]QJU54684.1 cell wall-binding repeat-containing protein [Herbiconiux sp. SALV-R1]WPO85787.1 cell wall-binding repeat-containing protein [Herbiconiux sp. KACC 21604]